VFKSNTIGKKVMVLAGAITAIGTAAATLSSYGLRPVMPFEMDAQAAELHAAVEVVQDDVGVVVTRVEGLEVGLNVVRRDAAQIQLWAAEREARIYLRADEEPPASVDQAVNTLQQKVYDLNVQIQGGPPLEQ